MKENHNFNIDKNKLVTLMSSENYEKSIHDKFKLKYNGGMR